MTDFCDLPSLDLKYGHRANRPDAPTSVKDAYWCTDSRQMFVSDLNLTWRDVGLLRYTLIDQPIDVHAFSQVQWTREITISGAGQINVEPDGEFFILGAS
jgi:hypothetical protein